MFKRLCLLGGAAFLIASGATAHADTITGYFTNGLSCSTSSPCGTITVTDNGSGGVTVTENLGSNFFVVTGNGTNHVSLAMDLDATATSFTNFSSLPTGLSWVTGTNPSPAGFSSEDYSYYVSLTGCNGSDCPMVSTLSFTINGVSTANFDLTDAYPFVSDMNVAGATGNVGASGMTVPTSPTPEPSSLALLGTTVLGAAGLLRRRFMV